MYPCPAAKVLYCCINAEPAVVRFSFVLFPMFIELYVSINAPRLSSKSPLILMIYCLNPEATNLQEFGNITKQLLGLL
jgi:hypothetical protein